MNLEEMKSLARKEVLEYAREFSRSQPAEWISVAGAMDLSCHQVDDLTAQDLGIIYSCIAADFAVWAVEGSPLLDWKAAPNAARKFCEAWNSGTLLP